MSKFLKLKNDFSNFSEIVESYDEELSTLEGHVDVNGITLQEANVRMPISYLKYAMILQELKSIERDVESKVSVQVGKCWQHYRDNSNIDYGTRDLDKITSSDEKVIMKKRFLNIVKELVGQYEVAVKSLEHLGYKLKNLTDARIAEVHKFVI
jgi:hypothetical protein